MLKKLYSLSTAGINTLIAPVKAPVNSIVLLEDSAVSEALAVVSVIFDDPATDLDILKSVGDLSVPIPAGKEVIICVYDHLASTPNDTTNLNNNGYELSCELFYAHAATSDGGTGGGGTA